MILGSKNLILQLVIGWLSELLPLVTCQIPCPVVLVSLSKCLSLSHRKASHYGVAEIGLKNNIEMPLENMLTLENTATVGLKHL